MIVIVASLPDVASANIRRRLLERASWEEYGAFEGRPVYRREDRLLVTIEDLHLDRDGLDREIRKALAVDPEVLVFASRHSSRSGIPSFTVHPLGNFGTAEFGGRPERLVPTSPAWMTQALRLLRERAAPFRRAVTFEATHHGPYLETPAFFVELGSDPAQWVEEGPAAVVADTLLALHPAEHPVLVGVGGGHYVPRMTDVALGRGVSFGHLIPSYAVETLSEAVFGEAVAKTPGATLAYVHRKALRGPARQRMADLVEAAGLRVVRTRDLEPLSDRHGGKGL
ncbi:MAG: D-aminoacyl-tRNA deacylase [Thermoplasmata archaeon]